MLSEVAVRQAKPKDKDYKLSDSEGLYLYVSGVARSSVNRVRFRAACVSCRLVQLPRAGGLRPA